MPSKRDCVFVRPTEEAFQALSAISEQSGFSRSAILAFLLDVHLDSLPELVETMRSLGMYKNAVDPVSPRSYMSVSAFYRAKFRARQLAVLSTTASNSTRVEFSA